MKLAGLRRLLTAVIAPMFLSCGAWSMTIELGSGGLDLIEPGDTWTFFRGAAAPSEPPDAWYHIDFNDADWETGESGFGYGDDDDETELDDMQDNYLAVYIRKEFTLDTVPASGQVVLEIDFDDGFIAYLNDDRAEERDHMPLGVATFETQASSHEAGTPERYSLGLASDVLVEGKNVLAIEGHNVSKGSTDFSLIPALRTSPDTVRNDEMWIVGTQTITLNSNTDTPAAVSVTIDGASADFNSVDGTWTGEVSLEAGLNTITVEALDAGAGVVDSGTAEVIYVPARNVFAGQLSQNTTWSGAVIVDETVVVPDSNILTIEPGTVVFITEDAAITVYGQLLANGAESEPIRFTHYGDGTTWERFMFIEAEDSRLAHCIIEYADCEGDHKDYYDNDCDPNTAPPSRDYFQAVVVIASHLDIENCLFENLPDDSSSPEGDAIAIISDDPDHPGEATANIIGCRFISIGQGVHTRFSYVLVEKCYFTGHHGDNDDVDLYGESSPPPLILNNVMINPGHDDMINPTRCSAILIGNIIAGCDDHGIVLRDKCAPVLINNLIYNCSSAGIAVQNQCDALLVNNTIFDCGRGIRFFDHTGRWDPPYCLFPGSGSATIVNCIIRDCPTSLLLTDSPWEGDRGSHATVINCNIEGGRAGASVSSNSTLTWGPGNIDADPQFVDSDGPDNDLSTEDDNFRLLAISPCIDAGDNNAIPADMFDLDGDGDTIEHFPFDFDGNPRFLDYLPAAETGFPDLPDYRQIADIGAYEFIPGDLDGQGDVGAPDFCAFALNWGRTACGLCDGADLTGDGNVDFNDWRELVANWLTGR